MIVLSLGVIMRYHNLLYRATLVAFALEGGASFADEGRSQGRCGGTRSAASLARRAALGFPPARPRAHFIIFALKHHRILIINDHNQAVILISVVVLLELRFFHHDRVN